MQANAPRRHHGRLRPLTTIERAKRQERRERLNPNREARKRSMLGRHIYVPKPRRKLEPGWFGKASRVLGR